MAPHSSTLAWKIPWMEEPGRLQSMGSLESDKTERLHFHFSLSCIGEGNGNPLQCSCLENPRDGGAWGAAIYGVAQSQTRLKRLSSSSSFGPASHCFSGVLPHTHNYCEEQILWRRSVVSKMMCILHLMESCQIIILKGFCNLHNISKYLFSISLLTFCILIFLILKYFANAQAKKSVFFTVVIPSI